MNADFKQSNTPNDLEMAGASPEMGCSYGTPGAPLLGFSMMPKRTAGNRESIENQN